MISLKNDSFKRFNRKYINSQTDLIIGLNKLQEMALSEFKDVEFALFKMRVQEPIGTQYKHKIFLNLSTSPIGSLADLLILFLTLYINSEVQKNMLSLEQIETVVLSFKEYLVVNHICQDGKTIQLTKIEEYVDQLLLNSTQDQQLSNFIKEFLENCILDTLLVLLYSCCDLIENIQVMGPKVSITNEQDDIIQIAVNNHDNILFTSHLYYLVLVEIGRSLFVNDETLVYTMINVTFNQLIISQFIWNNILVECKFKQTFLENHLTFICYLMFNNIHALQVDFFETSILVEYLKVLLIQLEKLIHISSQAQQLILQCIKFVFKYFNDEIFAINNQRSIVCQLVSHMVQLPLKQKQQSFIICWDNWKQSNQMISLLMYQQMMETFLNTSIQDLKVDTSEQNQGSRNIFFYTMLSHTRKSQLDQDDFQSKKMIFFIKLLQHMMLKDITIDVHFIFQQVDPLENLIQLKQHQINKSFQNYFHVNNYFDKILQVLKLQNFASLQDIELQFSMIVEPIKLAWLMSEQFDHSQIQFTKDFINYFSDALSLLNDPLKLRFVMDLLIDLITSLSSSFLRTHYKDDQNIIMKCFSQLNIQNVFFLKVSISIVLKSNLSNCLQLDFLKQLKQIILENRYNQTIFREQINFSFILQIVRTDGNAQKVNTLIEILQSSLKFMNNEIITELIDNMPMDKQLQQVESRMIRKDLFTQYVGSILQNVQQYEDSDNKEQQPSLQFLSQNSGIILKDFNEFLLWKNFTILFELTLDGTYFINQGCCKLGELTKDLQTIFFLSDEDRQQNICYLTFGFFHEDQQTYLFVEYLDDKLHGKYLSVNIDVETSQMFTLTLQFQHYHKSEKTLNIFINDQMISSHKIKFSLSSAFHESKRSNPVVTIGGPLMNGNIPCFDSFKSIQCTIRNFVVFDGLMSCQEIVQLIQKYINQDDELLDVLKSHLSNQIEIYNHSKEDHPQKNLMTEIHYLNIKSFNQRNHKLITDTLQIRDGMKVLKLVEGQKDTNLLERIFKTNRHSFSISQERNKILKVFYQNIFKIDQLSFAEMFMSLENMDLIYFIISLTTGSPVFTPNQDHEQFSNQSSLLQLERHQESTIFKMKKYFDSKSRQIFLVKAQGKTADQYVNLRQFQEQFTKKLRISNELRCSSPKMRKNQLCTIEAKADNFALQLIQIDDDLMEDLGTEQKIDIHDERKISIEQNISQFDQATTQQQLSSQKEYTSEDSKQQTTPPLLFQLHNGLNNFESFDLRQQDDLPKTPMIQVASYKPITPLYKFNSTQFYPSVSLAEESSPQNDRFKLIRRSQEVDAKVTTTNRLLSLNLQIQGQSYDSSLKTPSIKKIRINEARHKTLITSQVTIKCYESELFLTLKKKKGTSIKIEESQVEFISEYITLKGCYYGKVNVQNLYISFESDYEKRPDTPDHLFGTQDENLKQEIQLKKRISIQSIEEVHTRRFNLKEIAVEIFVKDHKSYFFNLYSPKYQKNFIKVLEQYGHCIKFIIDRRQAFITSDFQKQWQKGEITNFDYLMLINKYSGRTFNDINQYYIFPWVLNKYDSDQINLEDSSVYRDLSLPIGALNSVRLEEYKQRACTLEECDIAYFLYGSHYQTPAYIIHFLMRIEPFMSLAQDLQSGKFDNADRMFHSIQATWDSCMENSTDVKELTPEFYYHPEFLTNVSGIDFGKRSNGDQVNDVTLPIWAKTPQEFIETQRQALESSYVSQNIHSWINLIFGSWQFGEEAKKRDNLFYSTTYEQNLNCMDGMNHEDKKCYLQQIQSFGQTPYQLFLKPHEQRDQKVSIQPCLNSTQIDRGHKQFEIAKLFKFDRPVIMIKKIGIFIYLITTSKQVFKIKLHSLLEPKRDKQFEKTLNSQFFQLETSEKMKLGISKILPEEQSSMGSPNMSSPGNRSPTHSQSSFVKTSQRTMAQSSQQTQIVTFTAFRQFHIEEDFIWIGGYESGAVFGSKLDKLNQMSVQHSVRLHKKRITCMDFSKALNILCLGGKDNRVTVWNFNQYEVNARLTLKTPTYIIYGHEDPIKELQIIDSLVVSVDKKGKVLFHSISSGEYLKEILLDLGKKEKVRIMQVNEDGYMALLTNRNLLIITTFNGFQQSKLRVRRNTMITHMMAYQKKHLLLSTTNGEIFLIKNYIKLLYQFSDMASQLSVIYQNCNQMCIHYFTYYIEHETLYLLVSYVDGSLMQLKLKTEQDKQFKKGLKQVGLLIC